MSNARNNLKQIGTALNTHAETYGAFPPGASLCSDASLAWCSIGSDLYCSKCQGMNWNHFILEQLERTETYAEIVKRAITGKSMVNGHVVQSGNAVDIINDQDSDTGIFILDNFTTYICPSHERRNPNQDASDWDIEPHRSRGNYAACWGAGVYVNKTNNLNGTPAPSPKDGLFGVTFIPGWNTTYSGSTTGPWKVCHTCGVRPEAVHDGLSNTMAVSEVSFINSTTEARGTWTLNMPGAGGFMAKTRPNARGTNNNDDAFDCVPVCDLTIPPSDPMHCTQNRSDGNIWAAARSRHPNGVNVLMADGATGFVSNSVDIGTWQALATINGNDVAARPF